MLSSKMFLNNMLINKTVKVLPLAWIITLLLSFLMAVKVSALPEDSQQPIFISSDSAIKDDKQGLTIYRGKVDIKQGTLNIKADKVTIYSTEEEVTKIIAEGQPASFKQQPEIDRGDVTAKANTIEYKVAQKKIRLSKSASIDQEGSSITGDTIHYDMQAARIEAAGETNTETVGDGSSGRVQVVIPPPTQAPSN